MARFLTTADSISHIESVMRQAKGDLYLVSPFVQLSERYRRRLADADREGVRVHLICRVKELKSDQKKALSSLSNLHLYDAPKLHGKVFVNERGAVITSFNLYEASEQNHETGVWLCAEEDTEAYGEARREVLSILSHAKEVSVRQASGGRTDTKADTRRGRRSTRFEARSKGHSAPQNQGHCIRCGTGINYDPKKPYCPQCFSQWARFKNPTYADDRCHGCGKEEAKAFSLEKPECYACYKKHAKRTVA